jgi:hypothetical protein
MKIAKWTLTITVMTWTNIFLLGSSQLPNLDPFAQFSNGMPDWMNMTPEDFNNAVESNLNPSQGHIPPAVSLQDAMEHDRGKWAS